MATVTPTLRTDKANSDGHYVIRLRFADAYRTLYQSLGVSIPKRHWNALSGRVRKGHPHTDAINALIQQRLNDVEDERLRLLRAGELVTAEALKRAIAPNRVEKSGCFLAYARELIDSLETTNFSRYKKERTIFRKLEEFAGKRLPFDRVTPEFLVSFEKHLAGLGNKASTIQTNMKPIRAHFRRAMREGIVPRQADPFFSYTPPKASRADRHRLTETELSRIEALDLGETGPDAPLIARVRDTFLFSVYTAGMRFADVCQLRCRNIRVPESATPAGDEAPWILSYTMGKNDKPVSLILIAKARRIAASYLIRPDGKPKGKDDFLFPMLQGRSLATARDERNAISSENALTNKYLKKIARAANVEGNLSFHVARHSFAEIARRKGWDVYAISKALAHGDLSITEGYMAGFDSELVDSKMRELF